jgi:hypothetical protein
VSRDVARVLLWLMVAVVLVAVGISAARALRSRQ